MTTTSHTRPTGPQAAARTSPAARRRRRRRGEIGPAIVRVVVIVGAVLFAAGPVVYAFGLSLQPLAAVAANPLDVFPSFSELDFSAYSRALLDESDGGFGLGRFMRNSLVLASLTTLATLAVCVLGAYATARLEFRGRGAIGAIFLGVYVLPGIALAVPLYVLFSRIGLRGTLVGLVLIYMASTVPLAIYMLRNYFDGVPRSVEEAAAIDGAGRMQIIGRVVLPMTLPGIAATGLYIFMIAWNEYLYALLFLVEDRERWTVSLGVAQLATFDVPVTVLMAGSIAITLPVVIGFFASQRLLISGLTAGAEKG
ncbi:binding-protein-dependent transport systems inner membrane component [Beutenbergia cavernae DSM 12333]|uniref:Binding-protein-dependent transport systems inner membrane component n=1 Tax=Beutenbergia cavernae (strain ATCC BAA-8 / DSM 12333 / CCUG 43141 / JCM 11478 / NBRC 16432 / NCIMB 13614 / HKI 0122) TaxID=471853 RepID=C5BWB4_BEUC1|nr:carbohydrate ABC transporter permease [Beutenbergia cavernae]ACQ78572.1 binding-protein-dependent transport systems inner membrane component [Beutenbergia cavernae DSM 12333]